MKRPAEADKLEITSTSCCRYRPVSCFAPTLCSLGVILLAGCITPEGSFQNADLIAVPDGSFGGSDAFCDLRGGIHLRIVIQNQGQGDAPASTTRVAFSPGGTIDIPTPSVRAGQRTMLAPVIIPAACFDPDCDFRVLGDARGQVDGANGEENDSVDGRCTRP
jgi:hypothetical protein